MKKHLLLGLALYVAIAAFPQTGNKTGLATGIENTAEKIAQCFASRNNFVEPTPTHSSLSVQAAITLEEPPEQSYKTNNTSTLVSTWTNISGSMNIYGMLIENSKPLQYNEDLNAVSFIHRKPADYVPYPEPTSANAESGVLVGMVSQDWGATWNTTCIWNDSNNWARYPQGGIYNPISPAINTTIDNAYIVATAPITQVNTTLGWIGNAFASKQMGAANNNNSISVVPNAQQFFPSASPSLGIGNTDFARLDFQSLDNGYLMALGSIFQDVNGATSAAQNYTGAKVLKGSFNSGVFAWSGEAITPSVTSSGGTSNLIAAPSMAWSEDGTVGYVVHIGCSPNTLGNNVGFQPIVWKSVNGSSWTKVNGIDFNSPTMSSVTESIVSTRLNGNVAIPFFDFTMGISTTVDKDYNLHIAATVRGTVSSDPDSLGFTYLFTNADGESYSYKHVKGLRPYLYDFIGDGVSTWTVVTIDSLPSEGPGTRPTDNGFESNPWDATGGANGTDKVSSDARIQLSRTSDGKYVIYTFAESDTSITSNPVTLVSGVKWNQFPNVKARMMDVDDKTVSPTEINVTRPPAAYPNIITNVSVRSRAYFHYTSPKCKLVGALNNDVYFYLPITVSSNSFLKQLEPVTHRYISALLKFEGGVGISKNSINSVKNINIYPNPTNGNTTLAIDLKNNANVEVTVTNMVGQIVKSTKTIGYSGTNKINVDVNGLAKGIYTVNVKLDGAISTKKLIVE